MKIRGITEPQRFFEAVKSCKGSVELLTGEGDRLNMRSTLCQYIALTQMFNEGSMGDVELILSEPDEINTLISFLSTAED